MSLPRGILPVLSFATTEEACRVADILLDEGVTQLEIVFRSPQAAPALAEVARDFPELLLGAGTLKTSEDLLKAQAAGAQYYVTPCPVPEIETLVLQRGWDLIPGAATPGEAWAAFQRGFRCVKFFPAEALGGVSWLAAVSAPLPEISWLPTGGISLEQAETYLKLQSVQAVGVGEIARPADLAECRWDMIRQKARKAGEINARLSR